MGPKRFDRVGRTSRLEPAGPAQKWGQEQLVAPDEHNEELRCHYFDSPIRFNVDSKSLATSAAATFAAPDFAITTRSAGQDGWFPVLKASLIRRFALFLTTAPPTFRLATMPRRLSGPEAGDARIVR